MSQFRFAASAALVLLFVATSFAQDCGCTSQPAIPQCPTQACQTGCRGKACIPADQLWSNFPNEISCKGCVCRQRMQPLLPGFCGRPACDLDGCNVGKSNGIGIPHVSVCWPRPFHGANAACNSLTPKVTDVFNVFGLGRQKNVRCDVPNDCFGKLGESQACDSSYFKPLPPVSETDSSRQPVPAVNDQEIPPAPIVEPAPVDNNNVAPAIGQPEDNAMLPQIKSPYLNESAKNVQYGSYFRGKR